MFSARFRLNKSRICPDGLNAARADLDIRDPRRLKFVVAGDRGVGKKSLIQKFIDDDLRDRQVMQTKNKRRVVKLELSSRLNEFGEKTSAEKQVELPREGSVTLQVRLPKSSMVLIFRSGNEDFGRAIAR